MSYSPTLGRFIQTDPEQYVDGPNLYEAERSSPLKYVDPLGLAADPIDEDPTNVFSIAAWNKGIMQEQAAGNAISAYLMNHFIRPQAVPKFDTVRLGGSKFSNDPDTKAAITKIVLNELKRQGVDVNVHGRIAAVNGHPIEVKVKGSGGVVYETNQDLAHAIHAANMSVDGSAFITPCADSLAGVDVKLAVEVTDTYDFHRGAVKDSFIGAAANDTGARGFKSWVLGSRLTSS